MFAIALLHDESIFIETFLYSCRLIVNVFMIDFYSDTSSLLCGHFIFNNNFIIIFSLSVIGKELVQRRFKMSTKII